MSGSRKRRHSARLEAKQLATTTTDNGYNSSDEIDNKKNTGKAVNNKSKSSKPTYKFRLMKHFGAIYRRSANNYKFCYTRTNIAADSLESAFAKWVDLVGSEAAELIPKASEFEKLEKAIEANNNLQWASHALQTF